MYPVLGQTQSHLRCIRFDEVVQEEALKPRVAEFEARKPIFDPLLPQFSSHFPDDPGFPDESN